MAQNKPSRRHHFVPQGYLRGFGDQRQRVRVSSKDQSRPSYLANVRNVAVETDLYWLERHPEPDVAEKALAEAESICLPNLRDLARRGHVREQNARFNIAYYMALQFLRGPDIRDVWRDSRGPMFEQAVRDLNDEKLSILASEFGVTDTGDRMATIMQIIEREREGVTPLEKSMNVERVEHMFSLAAQLIPLIALRRWEVIRLRNRKFITCDRPLIIVDSDGSVLRGGFAESTTLFFPLTRDAAVLMRHVNGVTGKHLTVDMDDRVQAMLWSGLNDSKRSLNVKDIGGLNLAIARAAYRDIYCHPDDVKHLPEPLRTSFEGE